MDAVRTGQAHRTLVGHTAPVTCLQFDENHVVTGSLDRTVRVSSTIAPRLRDATEADDVDLGYTPRCCGRDTPIRVPSHCIAIRQSESCSMYRREWCRGEYRAMCLCCKGLTKMQIYNRTTHAHTRLIVNGHTKPAEKLRFIDRYLVSGGRDGTAKVWSM